MAEPIGKLEKPEAEKFREKRKLFFVPLLYAGEGVPQELEEKLDRYWSEVREQLRKLEEKLGRAKRIFHELIYSPGEEGLKALEKLNARSYQLAKAECEDGAELWPIEERELTEEWLDWQRCLLAGLISEKARKRVLDFYLEAERKRYEHMARRIDEGLREKEVGILFIREGHRIQFPADVEVFSIYPPSLDEIHRFLQERAERESGEGGQQPSS